MKHIFQKVVILASLLIIVISGLVINPAEVSADPAPSIEHCLYKRDCVGLLQDTEIKVYRVDRGQNLVYMGAISNVGSGSGGRLSYSEEWAMVLLDGFLSATAFTRIDGQQTCNPDVSSGCTEPGEGIVYGNLAFLNCPMNQAIAEINVDTCQVLNYRDTQHATPSSITVGGDRIYAMNSSNATIWNWSPLYTNGGFAYTFESSGKKVRFWDNGTDGIVFMNSGDNILAKILPLADGAPDSFYTLPAGWGEGDMDVNTTHLVQARGFGPDAMLMEIAPNLATPSSNATPLPLSEARNVAITANYVYAEDVGGSLIVTQVFDLTGNPVATVNDYSYDVASFYPTRTEGCTNSATGLAEPGEECDGEDFDGITCQHYGFDGGQLSCSATCDQIFTSGCWSCGDGDVNPGEECDDTNMNGATCADQGYANGTVSCTASCTVDYGQCYTCGNNVIEGPEQCEGADLQGNDCTTIGQGFMGGTLSCNTGTCEWDTTQCHKCGNGVTDTDLNETCDGTHVPDDVCETLGYDGGTLVCNSTCDGYDDTNCSFCGDEQLDPDELCNLDQFQPGITCGDAGFGTGTVTCFEDCTPNYFACSNPPATGCGNGTTDPGEECDDGNHSNDDGCSNDCRVISVTCGDLNVDTGEECDEPATSYSCSDLGLGYTDGVYFCNPETCFLNTDYCSFGNMQTISLQIDVDPDAEDDLGEDSWAKIDELKAAGFEQCCNGVQSIQDSWLVDGVPDNCYCTARVVVHGTNKRGFFVFYTPDDALGGRQPAFRVYPNGETRTEYGAWVSKWNNLTVQMVVAVEDGPRLMLTPAIKAEKAMRYVSSFVDDQGNTVTRASLGFKVNGGQLGLRLPNMSVEQAIQVTRMESEVFIPLDPDQLAAWFDDFEPPTVKEPKDKGCSTAGSPLESPLPIVVTLLFMLAIWRRRK
jgi:cysteine-rich repeat protein